VRTPDRAGTETRWQEGARAGVARGGKAASIGYPVVIRRSFAHTATREYLSKLPFYRHPGESRDPALLQVPEKSGFRLSPE
jgi:hypothetical protein